MLWDYTLHIQTPRNSITERCGTSRSSTPQVNGVLPTEPTASTGRLHFSRDLPDSGILRSAHSASNTAHLWPLFSFHPHGMGCCIQRAGETGHLTSNAWPPPKRGEDKRGEKRRREEWDLFHLANVDIVWVQQNKSEITCVFMWQKNTSHPLVGYYAT